MKNLIVKTAIISTLILTSASLLADGEETTPEEEEIIILGGVGGGCQPFPACDTDSNFDIEKSASIWSVLDKKSAAQFEKGAEKLNLAK